MIETSVQKQTKTILDSVIGKRTHLFLKKKKAWGGKYGTKYRSKRNIDTLSFPSLPEIQVSVSNHFLEFDCFSKSQASHSYEEAINGFIFVFT